MKPKIICHMMSSVDGRLFTERYTHPFDGKDRNELIGNYFPIADQLNGQAMIMGRNTLQQYFVSTVFEHKDTQPTNTLVNFIGKRRSKNCIIVVDTKGKVSYENEKDGESDFITIISENVSDGYLQHLREHGVSYVFAGKDGKDLAKAMNVLGEDFGIETLLLEGGGTLNGSFLKAGLIDELSLMIYPGIDGLSGVATIFEYAGASNELPADKQALELTSMQLLDEGIVWLRYRFHNLSNPSA